MQQVDFKNLEEGETTKQILKTLAKTLKKIPKATWTSFNVGNTSTC
jgi:hypothetical protein